MLISQIVRKLNGVNHKVYVPLRNLNALSIRVSTPDSTIDVVLRQQKELISGNYGSHGV
jgi:hypothetical protein